MRLDDERWDGLCGGRREPYDPRPALDAIEDGDAKAGWKELWDNLHHQGDVGIASYAAVPAIVRLMALAPSPMPDAYGLLATIEECRLEGWPANPAMPDWLKDDYEAAWHAVLGLAARDLIAASDDNLIQGIFAVLAFAKGQPRLGAIALIGESERQEMLDAFQRRHEKECSCGSVSYLR